MISKEELKKLESKKNKLEKKDIDLIISDFDDTIFSTHEVLEQNTRKWRRWNEWNKYIKEVIWVENFINNHYANIDYHNHISSKLRENHDLILTAWYEEIQIAKLKACKIDHINHKIVFDAENKIIETIKYVVDELWFIPNKITVYEDRPNFFIEYKDFMEDFLWIEVEIMYVEMNWHENIPKITKIDKKID